MTTIALALLAIGAATGLRAQGNDSDQLALAVAGAQEANRAAIAHYSWHVKSTISKNGEVMATSVAEMLFNQEGKVESTPVGGESNVKEKRGLRGRAQQSEMEDFEKYLQGVLDHSASYIFMSKGTLVDFFDRAKVTESDTAIDAVATGLFVEGDELHLVVDPKTKLATSLTFKTTYENDPISGSVTMGMIEGGPGKPVSFEFDIPSKSVKITAETYDWIKQQ